MSLLKYTLLSYFDVRGRSAKSGLRPHHQNSSNYDVYLSFLASKLRFLGESDIFHVGIIIEKVTEVTAPGHIQNFESLHFSDKCKITMIQIFHICTYRMGAFKNYVDRRGWVGGQSNVYESE